MTKHLRKTGFCRTIRALALSAFALAACGDSEQTATQDTGATLDATANTDVSSDSDADSEEADAAPGPPSIAEELGLLIYDGKTTPSLHSSEEGGVTNYTWDIEDGPQCMRGEPFVASVRDTDSNDLVIFLQGGGACWSDFCFAITRALPGMPDVDILRTDLEVNPVADWDVVYLPYCDGSFFAGDNTLDDNLNGKGTRYHRGLANLSAGIDLAKARFPNPGRVLLAGSSGGSYGLLLAAPLVRHHYPDTELVVMFDSGIGLARTGEPEFIQLPLDEFGVGRFVPDDCTECVASGHITALVQWYLERDEEVRIGFYGAWRDSILSKIFLRVEPSDFAEALRDQTGPIHENFPDRFRRFITAGKQHTSLLGTPAAILGGDLRVIEMPTGLLQDVMAAEPVILGLETTSIGELNVGTWLGGLIEGDLDVWVDILEEDIDPELGEGSAE